MTVPTTSPYDELGELYDEWVASVVEDVPFYLRVAGECAAARAPARAGEAGRPLRVLELGAGSGRIAVPLALRGHEVTALDTSGVQLDRLVESARRAGVADGLIRPVLGDMRRLGSLLEGERFDLAIAPFRSLLHVGDDPQPVFAQLRQLLEQHAAFAFDVFHPAPDAMRELDGQWLIRQRASTAGGTWSIWERARMDEDGGSIQLDVRCDWRSVDGTADQRRRQATLELHVPPAQVWRQALEDTGFELVSVYGWFDGRPFAPTDDDSVWLVRAS